MPVARKTAKLKSANLRKPLNKTTANKNSSRVSTMQASKQTVGLGSNQAL